MRKNTETMINKKSSATFRNQVLFWAYPEFLCLSLPSYSMWFIATIGQNSGQSWRKIANLTSTAACDTVWLLQQLNLFIFIS